MSKGRIKVFIVDSWVILERKQGHFAYYPPLAKLDLQLKTAVMKTWIADWELGLMQITSIQINLKKLAGYIIVIIALKI